MSAALHCDLDGCDTWTDDDTMRHGWICVTEASEYGEHRIGDYCCGWHAAQDLARRFEPPIEVAL